MTAFFERDGDLYVPGDFCRGPWNRESLHGRAISALLGYGIEQHVPAEDWHIARLTVDMFRLAPHLPVRLRTELVRDGNRVRSVEAALLIEGVEVARGSGLVLRRADVPSTALDEGLEVIPSPDSASAMYETGEGPFGDHRDGWDTRLIREEGAPDASFAWMRMGAPFIGGEATSAFVRTAGAADFANPHSNRSQPRMAFINADMTLHLHRYPEGAWLGFEARAHNSVGGIAIGSCRLYDLTGPVGFSTVATIANDRERTRSSRPSVAG